MDELRDLYRARRDTMLEALAEHLPAEATWTRPQGGLFVWATLPDYLDTTDLLALALSHNVAFVPGRAAFLDGRGGSSLRLNFSGSSEDDIREGIRRIGEIVREQVELYGALTGHPPATPPPPTAPGAGPGLADVLALPRRREPAASATRDERRAARRGAAGRTLAGAPGLARLRRARRGRAGASRPRRDAIDIGHDLVARLQRAALPTSCSSRCTAATARTARSRSCSRCSACATPARGPRAARGPGTRCSAKELLREAGVPTPDALVFSETRRQGARRGGRPRRRRGAAGLPGRRQAGLPGQRARGSASRRRRPTCRAR